MTRRSAWRGGCGVLDPFGEHQKASGSRGLLGPDLDARILLGQGRRGEGEGESERGGGGATNHEEAPVERKI